MFCVGVVSDDCVLCMLCFLLLCTLCFFNTQDATAIMKLNDSSNEPNLKKDSERHPEKMCCICFEVILVEDTVVILPSTDMFRFWWRASIY